MVSRRDKLDIIWRVLILSLAAVMLLSAFYDVHLLTFLLGTAVLLTSLPLLGGVFRIPTLFFFLCSLIVAYVIKMPFSEWIAGTNSMLSVITIIAIMQMFTVPIEAGKYSESLEYLFRRRFTMKVQLYAFVKVITHLLGSFLLFGNIPVMMALLNNALKRNIPDYERFAATAISRSQSLVTIWAPGAINVILVMEVTGVKWIQIFIPGMIITVLGILSSIFLEMKTGHFKEPRINWDTVDDQVEQTEKEAWQKVIHIVLAVLGMITITIILEARQFSNASTRTSIAGLVVVLCWIMKYGRSGRLKEAFGNYWKQSLNKGVDLAALFIAIGIFSKVFEQTGLGIYFFEVFPLFSNEFIAVILLPFIIVLFSLLGIHPFVSIGIIASILGHILGDIQSVPLAVALAFGGPVAYNVSPFGGIILMLSKYLERSPVEIALKWNGLFTIILLGEGIAVLLVLTYLY